MSRIKTNVALNTTNPGEVQEIVGQMENFGFLPTHINIGAGTIAGYCEKAEAESLYAVEGITSVFAQGDLVEKLEEPEDFW